MLQLYEITNDEQYEDFERWIIVANSLEHMLEIFCEKQERGTLGTRMKYSEFRRPREQNVIICQRDDGDPYHYAYVCLGDAVPGMY